MPQRLRSLFLLLVLYPEAIFEFDFGFSIMINLEEADAATLFPSLFDMELLLDYCGRSLNFNNVKEPVAYLPRGLVLAPSSF